MEESTKEETRLDLPVPTAYTALNVKGRKMSIGTYLNAENKLIIEVCNADINYAAVPDEQMQVFEDEHTEEEFHTSLRRDAEINGHLVRQYCTNPEYHPKKQIVDEANKTS